jgi:cytoskeletal protein CcmA (bactofilin family)
MFGAKTKREIHASMKDTSTMSNVNQKIDALQSTLAEEQQANVSDSFTPPSEVLQNMIGKGTVIEGNVQAEGDLFIDGTVKGDVTTKTKLVAGPSAIIEGNILAQHAEIAGRVQGTVKALGLLVINSSGTILGDVITKDLNVESGSTFNGRLQVGGNISSTPIEIAKVAVKPVVAVTPAMTESVFDVPVVKKSESSDKTAEQLAANLAKSALLH